MLLLFSAWLICANVNVHIELGTCALLHDPLPSELWLEPSKLA